MVNIVVSQNRTVTGDMGKIIAYEGNEYSDVINITHPILNGAKYYIEYKYDNTIFRNELDANNRVSIKVDNAGYVKCQFVATDLVTGDALFKSNYWYFIVKECLKVESSHYPCSNIHHYKHKPPIDILNQCTGDKNMVEMITKIYNELQNEETIRFNENQDIIQQLSNIINDIDVIKEKIHIIAPDEYMSRLNITKSDDYLYDIYYNEYDYEKALEYFKDLNDDVRFGCSAIYNSTSKLLGRNFDYHYTDVVSFPIIVSQTKDRYGSIGVAHGTSHLTQKFVDSNQYHDDYKILPYFTVDGMNTAGLRVIENSLPAGDMGYTIDTNPNAKDKVCTLMIPRLLLDNCATIQECINLLESKNIYAPNCDKVVDEHHYLIVDNTGNTAVIEFIYDNDLQKCVMKVILNECIMTNFYLTGYDGTRNSLTPHACGIERYNTLNIGMNSASSLRGMISLMKSIYYTNAYNTYANPFWYSEFSHDYGAGSYGDLTKDNIGDAYLGGDLSKAGSYEPLLEKMIEIYNQHKRDGVLWQTVHTTVYDWINKKMIVISQEGSIEHEYSLSLTQPE